MERSNYGRKFNLDNLVNIFPDYTTVFGIIRTLNILKHIRTGTSMSIPICEEIIALFNNSNPESVSLKEAAVEIEKFVNLQ